MHYQLHTLISGCVLLALMSGIRQSAMSQDQNEPTGAPAPDEERTRKASKPGDRALPKSSKPNSTSRLPVYILPYYDSKGPMIQVGKYSKELTSADPETILKLTDRMKKEWETLTVAQMYVTSIRLFDLGHRDEAVYWFYSAQFRSRVFMRVYEPLQKDQIELPEALGWQLPAHVSFFQVLGVFLNPYAHKHPQKLISTVERVEKESRKLPDVKLLYPPLKDVPLERWETARREVAEGIPKFVKLLETIDPSNGKVATTEDLKRAFSPKTPLQKAFENGDRNRFVKLLEDGADPNFRPPIGRSLLHLTSGHHDSFWLRHLLKHGGDPNLIDTGHPYAPESSPINAAIADRQHGNVLLLINAGADVNYTTSHGGSALRQCTTRHMWHTMLALLDAGADPRTYKKKAYTQRTDTRLLRHYNNLDALARSTRESENRRYHLNISLEQERANFFKLRERLIKEGIFKPADESVDKSSIRNDDGKASLRACP